VGGSVKFQRQSLAGLSGSGLGLDLGLLGRPGLLFGQESGWSERLTWGFAIRNLLEPSLRLDSDSVNDPTGVRTGFAYRHPFSQRGHFLTTLDLEKTKGSDADLHLGFEARIHPVLALRGGWNAGGLTTGAGLYWRQLVVDYVRDSNDIDAVHRIGVGLRFGSSVEERRQAALRAQEEELQAKLAATFEERQRARVTELLQRVNVLLGQKQFDEALQTLATVIALEPENPRVQELEAQVLRGKAQYLESLEEFAEAAILYLRVLAMAPGDTAAQAGLARCREASDRRAERTARIQQLFASALDAFAAGDPVAARTDLLKILEVDPEDAEAKAMLERARGAIQARATDLLASAGRFIDRGLLDEARELISQAQSLDPHAEGIHNLNSRLRKAERQLARAVERTAADRRGAEATSDGAQASVERPPPLSKKRQKELADLYKNGMSAMEEGRSDEALHYWELVWAADPGYQNVTEYLKREYLLRGLSSFSRGDLDDAVRLWEKALNFDPNDKRTIGYLARAREQQTRTREILGVD
jgi:tetratricopeptide (TPR) repeat protein